MRTALAAAANRRATRSRSASLSAVPPAETSNDYIPELATIAASILYRSPLPSRDGRPVYILNAAAFPDAWEVDYDSLLSYVLARLPGEEELISGTEYEIIFFAGGQPEGATSEKKQGPGMGWYLQAYHVLSRATRKKLQRLYIVHPRTWVRVLIGVFGTIVSPKFRRKIVHVNTLSQLALQIPIERLLIPPPVFLHDRKLSPEIDVPYATGRRAFGARHPLPKDIITGKTRLPRLLRETTGFIILPQNLATEGLFRIPPHSVLANVLKEAYDRGQQYIVWKEKDATFVQPGISQELLDEVRLEDAYGVHLAASLIKQWYRDLREPIFPESSYASLREKYGSPDAVVQPEDLVDLIMPASPTSALTATSREILTRHLLPLLSAVAAHEQQNKMNAENLAILFSMCMVCGANQLEDAKMASTVIKKILEATIAEWPQLREGLSIDVHAFEADLRAPADIRDYEDPLEDESQTRNSEDDALETREGHRIVMTDADEDPEPKRAPTLPPRKVRPDVITTANEPSEPKRAPTLPPRPARSRAASGAKQLPTLDVSSPVRRKPAPTVTESAPAAFDPPRYSTVFDIDGQSLHVADSPSSYTPADGFGPARRGESIRLDEKKSGLDGFPEPTDPHPALNIPKRKAVSGDTKDEQVPTGNRLAAAARSVSESSKAAKAAAQKAAESLAHRVLVPRTNGDSEIVQSPDSVSAEGGGEGTFRKPSWPASAARQHPSMQSSLAKPALPPRQAQNVPIIFTPSTNGNVNSNVNSNGNSNNLAAPTAPRPRAPSPGLLKRMENMEASNAKPTLEQPRRLNLRKASVDDLRRLYEERLNTAEGLKRADAARRGSSQTS